MKTKAFLMLCSTFLLFSCGGNNPAISSAQTSTQKSTSEEASLSGGSSSNSSPYSSSISFVSPCLCRFYNETNLLYSVTVEKGSDVFYRGIAPRKASTAQYSYSFTGWDKALENIQEATDFYAQYDKTIRSYMVRFLSEGEVLQKSLWEYGSYATFKHSLPSKAASGSNRYFFLRWDKDPAQTLVDKALDFTAVFQNIVQYQISFVDEQGKIVQSSYWEAGSVPVFSGVTPTKASDSVYSYVFSGWSPTLSSATKDQVYRPLFAKAPNIVYTYLPEEKAYAVSSCAKDVDVLSIQASLPYSSILTYPVRKILKGAFQGSKAKEVLVPASVTKIEEGAFSGMVNLTTITISPANPSYLSLDGVLYDKNKATLCRYPEKKSGAFALPSSVTALSPLSFEGCSLLESLDASSVTSIGEQAFFNCSVLTSLTFGSKLTAIGLEAFAHCPLLQNALFAADSLLPEIPRGAFLGDSSLSQIVLPSVLKTVSSASFSGCSSLVSFPWGAIERIADSAFANDLALTDLVFPSSLLSIEGAAFYNCSALKSVVLPSGLKSLGAEAFAFCTLLKDFVIPDSVTSIGQNLLKGDAILESVSSPLPNDALYSDPLAYLFDRHVPASLKSLILRGDKTLLERSFANNGVLEKVTLEGVVGLEEYAFFGCAKLQSIAFPATLQSLGVAAFYGCVSLTSADLSKTALLSVSVNAFRGDKNLTSVLFPSALALLGESAFEGCEGLTKIRIPASVLSMGSFVFRGCSHLAIECEASAKPVTWAEDWNIDQLPVTWNVH